MNSTLWLIGAAGLCVAGMAWLALSLKVHWQQVFNNTAPASPKILRTAGSAALALSAVCCFAADHPSMAALVWVMFTAASALVVAMTLSYQPKILSVIAKPFGRGL